MKEGFLLQRSCRLQKQSFPSTQNSYFSKHRPQPMTAQKPDERSEGGQLSGSVSSLETNVTSSVFPHPREELNENQPEEGKV